LIGDSGELDPEIYAQISAEFPQQIQAIWIRDVTQQSRSDPRYQRIFGQLPASRWNIFTEASQIQLR
jgi:phosphatidate phosphatase APP1